MSVWMCIPKVAQLNGVYPKMKIVWKYTLAQAIQDVDKFVYS